MKTCGVCKKDKPLVDFTKDKYRKDGHDRRCKDCKAEIYSKIPKTERQKWRRGYYEKHINQELALCAIYRETNRAKRNQYIKDYYKAKPWKGSVKTAKYRATKLNATPVWLTRDQFLEIIKIYENCPKGYHVDHIVPLQGKQVTGLHVPWNLQYLPAKENQRKGNRISLAKSA